MKDRKQEGLKVLGNDTEYLHQYTPEVLETFENRHQENDYWVRFNCRSLLRCAQSRDSLILQRFAFRISPTSGWWKASL